MRDRIAEDPKALERTTDAVVTRLSRRGHLLPRVYVRAQLERLEVLPTWVSPTFVADLVEVGFDLLEEVQRER